MQQPPSMFHAKLGLTAKGDVKVDSNKLIQTSQMQYMQKQAIYGNSHLKQ